MFDDLHETAQAELIRAATAMACADKGEASEKAKVFLVRLFEPPQPKPITKTTGLKGR
jgi:hypothetical protein